MNKNTKEMMKKRTSQLNHPQPAGPSSRPSRGSVSKNSIKHAIDHRKNQQKQFWVSNKKLVSNSGNPNILLINLLQHFLDSQNWFQAPDPKPAFAGACAGRLEPLATRWYRRQGPKARVFCSENGWFVGGTTFEQPVFGDVVSLFWLGLLGNRGSGFHKLVMFVIPCYFGQWEALWFRHSVQTCHRQLWKVWNKLLVPTWFQIQVLHRIQQVAGFQMILPKGGSEYFP